MKRTKKFIIIAVITVVTLGGILGGVAVASADDEVSTTIVTAPDTRISDLAERVAAAYEENTGVAIDPDELIKAFNDVREDISKEARDSYLDKLVDEGKITEEQAQEFKDWLDARPDVPVGPVGPGMMKGGRFFGRFGENGTMFGIWGHGRCGPDID